MRCPACRPAPSEAPSINQQLVAALLARAPSQHIAAKISRDLAFGSARASPGARADDLEAGRAAAGADLDGRQDSLGPGAGGEGGGEAGGDASSGPLELRLRVLHGLKHHFRSQRMAGLLSPGGLRVARWAG
jgi:hypothetical protein